MVSVRPLRRHNFKALTKLSMDLFSRHNEAGFPITDASISAMLNSFLANSQGYFRGLFDDEELVGWMYCMNGHSNHHSAVTGMSQVYYHSSLTGMKAVRGLLLIHEDFFKFAEKRGIEIAVTSSSLPNSDVFVRILQKGGWTPVGNGRLTRATKHHRGTR